MGSDGRHPLGSLSATALKWWAFLDANKYVRERNTE
jgi:hypothetical protein